MCIRDRIGGYLCELSSQNPKEMAHHVLERVLESTGELPMDDMTVIAVSYTHLEADRVISIKS